MRMARGRVGLQEGYTECSSVRAKVSGWGWSMSWWECGSGEKQGGKREEWESEGTRVVGGRESGWDLRAREWMGICERQRVVREKVGAGRVQGMRKLKTRRSGLGCWKEWMGV